MPRKLQFSILIIALTFIVITLSVVQAQLIISLPGKDTSELLTNQGFETDSDADKFPDSWTAKNTELSKSDKLKCNKPDTPVAHTGNCAFMFRGNVDGVVSSLTQKLTDFSAINDGTTVTFSTFVDPLSSIAGAIIGKATITLSDSTKFKLKLTIPGAAGYTQVSDSIVLTFAGESIAKVQIKLLNNQSQGKFFIDDVSLSVTGIASTDTPVSTDLLTNTPIVSTNTATAEASTTPTNTTTATATVTFEPSATMTSTPTTTPIPSPVQLFAADLEGGDEFGSAIAVDGNTAVVGAMRQNEGQGAAYVFVWNGSAWIEQQKLTAGDAEISDLFGSAVAISGDTIFVSAPTKASSHGAVYVFTRSGDMWTQQQKLVSNNAANLEFGTDVAVEGDTALIYAWTQFNGPSVAYVFTRNGTVWSEQQKLGPKFGSTFGTTLALTDNTAIIGESEANAAYIFTRNGGIWSEQQTLIPDHPSSLFGWSVGVSGDTAMIGDPTNTISTVYVFTRNGGSWSEQQTLTASDADENGIDSFGFSLTLSDNIVLIGSPYKNDRGQAYLFRQTGDTWIEQQILKNEDIECCAQALFGYALALHTSTILVTEPSGYNTGVVWIYPLP